MSDMYWRSATEAPMTEAKVATVKTQFSLGIKRKQPGKVTVQMPLKAQKTAPASESGDVATGAAPAAAAVTPGDKKAEYLAMLSKSGVDVSGGDSGGKWLVR